jgi:hypothetical protein
LRLSVQGQLVQFLTDLMVVKNSSTAHLVLYTGNLAQVKKT